VRSFHQERFIEIGQFLEQYSKVHEIEFIKRYPHPLPAVFAKWVSELEGWSLPRLAKFESYPHEDRVDDPLFKEFVKSVRKLSLLERRSIPEAKLGRSFTLKLNAKKRHEIQTLKTIVDSIPGLETVIDVGGGAGHLSSALLSQSKLRSICIDRDSDLQKSGEDRIRARQSEVSDRIRFLHDNFKGDSTINEKFSLESAAICGLHGCGDLSLSILRYAVKNHVPRIFNLGCCYHLLSKSYTISEFAREHGLPLTRNALHLAARSSAVVGSKDLEKRFRMKRYRYSLHIFLYDHFSLPFCSIGNARIADYQGEFCNYAKKYHPGQELIGIEDGVLNDFYQNPLTQKRVDQIILADTVRLLLGRLIEIYILSDRALFLEESGRRAELTEVFDRKLSPRNILLESIGDLSQAGMVQIRNHG